MLNAAYLQIEDLGPVEPLGSQFGVWPQKTVPDDLLEPLFGEVEPDAFERQLFQSQDVLPPLATYLLLDAAKLQWGEAEIEDCGSAYRCLFRGKAGERLKDSAPYLIRLDQDSDFTKRLLTYDPDLPEEMTSAHLWHKSPGVIVRSRAGFDDLYRHFRKFTQVMDNDGKWYFVKFYDPAALPKLLEALGPNKARHFFGDLCARFICAVALDRGDKRLLSIREAEKNRDTPAQGFVLDKEVSRALDISQTDQFLRKALVFCKDNLPDASLAKGVTELEFLHHHFANARSDGFVLEDAVLLYLAAHWMMSDQEQDWRREVQHFLATSDCGQVQQAKILLQMALDRHQTRLAS